MHALHCSNQAPPASFPGLAQVTKSSPSGSCLCTQGGEGHCGACTCWIQQAGQGRISRQPSLLTLRCETAPQVLLSLS